jgi:hypothetical protein
MGADMSDPRPMILAVDRPPPPELKPQSLGVGLVGTPDELRLVFHDELLDAEVDAIRAGAYGLAFKLFATAGVAGLVWRLQAAGSDMVGYADYSLRKVRRQLGDDIADEFAQRARDASLAGSPGYGLPIVAVFVSPDSGLVIALRCFTLPRLFSDRFLRAISATDTDTAGAADAIVDRVLASGTAAWSMGLPGVAVAGEELELDDGAFERLTRDNRRRRTGR